MSKNWRTYVDVDDGFVYTAADGATTDECSAVDFLASDLAAFPDIIEDLRRIFLGKLTLSEAFGADDDGYITTTTCTLIPDVDGVVITTWLEEQFEDVRFTRAEMVEIFDFISANPNIMRRESDDDTVADI